MFTESFIRRPRLAIVISLVITIAGLICLVNMPTAQYPNITPPSVSVRATYPGADASVIETTVAEVIEQAVNGVEGMLYMSSTSSDNSYSLQIVFELGTNEDMNAVNVQNRIKTIESSLPQDVQRLGVTVDKRSSSMLMMIMLRSPNGTYDERFLTSYMSMNVEQPIARVAGVANVNLFGIKENSMRIWLNPERMANINVSVAEVVAAIESQNMQAAAGSVGLQPSPEDQQFKLTVKTKGRLSEPEEFENIVIRVNSDGSMLKLKDIARVEIGSKYDDVVIRMNGEPSANMAVYQLAKANGVQVAKSVRAELDRLSQTFPEDLELVVVGDMTTFVSYMIDNVVHTLIEAFIIVLLVIFLFTGNIRATIIPMFAIPVSLIGSFIVLYLTGSSANNITLLALVLAIGTVVDDAIVVVENVERIMHENPNLTPKQATAKAMSEITMPIIAITMVLLAVFVPVAFFPGTTGALYQQFAITIISAVVFSMINALTLSPALCALLMKPGQKPLGFMTRVLGFIDFTRDTYALVVGKILRLSMFSLLAVALVGFGTVKLYNGSPQTFLNSEDMGFFMGEIQLPDGASLNRTVKVSEEVRQLIKDIPGVKDVFVINGFSILNSGQASNSAFFGVILDDYKDRDLVANSVDNVIAQIYQRTFMYQKANVIAFNMPPIQGLGSVGGFEYQLQTLAGATPEELTKTMQEVSMQANKDPRIGQAYSTYTVNTPELYLNIDREKALSMGINMNELFAMMQFMLSSYYINDFNQFGKNWEVKIMADQEFRTDEESVKNLYIRNGNGEMVQLRNILDVESRVGPSNIQRYNGYRSIRIQGNSAPGRSTGDAIAAMEEIQLPFGYSYEWTGTAMQEKASAGATIKIFALAFLFSYLFLVALYESWVIPMPVIASIIVALFGGILFIAVSGNFIDLYVQIAIVVLIALSSKNAILMVEFCKEARENGATLLEAAVLGAKMRYRAVLMTGISFIGGVLPMAIAQGVGAAAQHSIGITIMGGMIFACTIGLFFIPTLYVAFETIAGFVQRLKGRDPEEVVRQAAKEIKEPLDYK